MTADLKVAVMAFLMGYSKEDWRVSEMDDSMVFLMAVLTVGVKESMMAGLRDEKREVLRVEKTPGRMEAQMAA